MEALARAAKASGAINASPDSDGVLRRLPVLVSLDGQTYPSLALAAVHLAEPGTLVLESDADGTGRLRLGSRSVALDGAGQALLRFRGPGRTYPHVSAGDVLAGRLGAGQLTGRLVFVGATALGVRDVAATAIDPRFPGVELHATLADALLGGAASAPAPAGGAVDLALAYVGTPRRCCWCGGWARSTAVAPRSWPAACCGSAPARSTARPALVVSPIGAMLALGLGAVVTVATQLAAERRRADPSTGAATRRRSSSCRR